MREDNESLSHTRWNCNYHIVFAPKYRRQIIYGKYKSSIGKIIRDLCERKGVTIHEANACSDHIHMLVSIPPKLSIASFMGYLKGKSSLMIFDKHANLKYKYGNRKILVQRLLCRYSRSQSKGNCRVYLKSITGRQGSRPTHFI